MRILKRKDTGADVKALQEQLLELKYSVGKAGADGVFGEQTEKAVMSFQKSNKIKVDGEVGNDTRTLLDRVTKKISPEVLPEKSSSDLVKKALETALTQVGVVENPRNSNRGKEVEAYLASIGLGGGYAWCMAFVYWCVAQAAKELNASNPLLKTGGVLYQYNSRPKLHVVRPEAGDIFIMAIGSKGAGHTGFVTKVDGQWIHTVEGNTNNAGAREGDGVYRRQRKISSCKGFLRLDKLS